MRNLQCFVFIALSVAGAVCMALFKPVSAGIAVLVGVLGVLGALIVRFAYPIALLSNRWYSLWRRRSGTDADDEPSTFAIVVTKLSGYLIVFGMQILLFL